MKFEKLKNIVEVKKGKKPSFVDTPDENSVRVLQIDDLRNDTNPKFTNDKTGVFAKEDDVLIAWDGANAGTIGYGKSGYIGSTIALLRKKQPDLYSTTFIGIFLQSQYQYLRSKTTGATIPHISRKALEDLEIPVLSVNDQLHIANVLSKAENLIAQRKESIRLLDEFLKSTFLEMFGDPVRNEKGWNFGRFKDLATLDRKQVLPSDFTKEDFYIGLENIEKETGNIIKTSSENAEDLKSSKFRFTPNHILYAKLRPYLNKVALPYQSGICSTDIFPVLPLEGKSNRFFICYLMRSKPFVTEMHSKSSGANLPRASASVIENFKTYQPPIELQTQFAQIVEKTEALKTQYQQSLQELENLYGSLSQKAFRGELIKK
jgi:restriction endonuclease S subunit